MAKKNRNTLKRYFSKGALPTADQFEDLIDSAINIVDENIDHTDENGFEISLLGSNERLVSLIRNYAAQAPEWTVNYDHEHDRLQFSRVTGEKQQPLLTLSPEGRVGVKNSAPQSALDVAGMVRSEGTIGSYPTLQSTVEADGNWHDLIGPLSGCVCFDVVARAGLSGTGKHAIMRATVMNAYNPTDIISRIFSSKKSIRYQDAYYLTASSRILLQWTSREDGYYLQIKTRCNYGANALIYYHVTSLWDDEMMSNSESGLGK